MKLVSVFLIVIFCGAYFNKLHSEQNNSDNAKYHKDALQCHKDAQVSHEIKIDVGQSKELVKIPSGIDASLFSICMKNLGHEININDDKFLSVHDICQETAKTRTHIKTQDNKLYIESPDSKWYEECYKNNGILVDVVE